jgi:hypothetical protein
VLVAVELVLESGLPSAEHVENVLNRLNPAPAAGAGRNALTVSERRLPIPAATTACVRR